MRFLLSLSILLATALPGVAGTLTVDTYGGYREIQSLTKPSYTGVSSHLDAHRLVDTQANFPPHSLVGLYLHPTIQKRFWPTNSQTKYRRVLRYRIIKNTRTEIFTAPDDGDLTTYAKPGDTYKTSGFFTVEKIGSRWWYMTPEGHAFIALSVSVLTPKGKDGRGPSGKTHGDHVQAKYGGPRGDQSNWRANWANAAIARAAGGLIRSAPSVTTSRPRAIASSLCQDF